MPAQVQPNYRDFALKVSSVVVAFRTAADKFEEAYAAHRTAFEALQELKRQVQDPASHEGTTSNGSPYPCGEHDARVMGIDLNRAAFSLVEAPSVTAIRKGIARMERLAQDWTTVLR